MTADNLFGDETVGLSDSPKRKWLLAHNLCTYHTEFEEGTEDDFGNPVGPWTCCGAERPDDVLFGRAGTGQTEQDAIADYAVKHKLKLWNEEG